MSLPRPLIVSSACDGSQAYYCWELLNWLAERERLLLRIWCRGRSRDSRRPRLLSAKCWDHQGEAEARLVKAKAEAEALRVVAEALQEMKGGEAAQLQVCHAMGLESKSDACVFGRLARRDFRSEGCGSACCVLWR